MAAPAILDGAAVRAWVKDPGADDTETTLIADVSNEMIGQMVVDLDAEAVPPTVKKLAALDLAADLWDQRTAPNGVRMFTDGMDGPAPVRVRADATARARRILQAWLPPTID